MSTHDRHVGSSRSSLTAPPVEHGAAHAGKSALTDVPIVQRRAGAQAPKAADGVHAAAAEGTSGASGPLPYGERIQQLFGSHDISGIQAHTDDAAARGSGAMGAKAFASGNHVAFGEAPDLHTAAHEAAHVVQQRGGVQLKGGVGEANDAHERQADEVADRVVAGQSSQDLLDKIAGGRGGGAAGHAVQRKAGLKPAADAAAPSDKSDPSDKKKKGGKAKAGPAAAIKELNEPEVEDFLTEHGVIARAQVLYLEVLKTKPSAIADKPEVRERDMTDPAQRGPLIKSWLELDTATYLYEDNPHGAEKLLKDAFKYDLHHNQQWKSVGVAEYMTGDATGLALAPIADDRMTIKVLTGQQKKPGSGKEPTFLDKPDPERPKPPEDRLPRQFDTAKAQNQIAISDSAQTDKYGGTADLYRRRYNVHDKADPVKPWNQETHAATSAIGAGLGDEATAKRLRAPLELGNSEGDQDAKANITNYKRKLDARIEGRQCLMLWGRSSGQKGGAHKELDSHASMIEQLATELRSKFPSRMLVFVGDQVIQPADVARMGITTSDLLYLGEFWNDPEYGKFLKTREQQRYLCSLFDKENDAVSIGMRSGSLEGMALLGMRVVFIDDLGNNAAGRMESWAGTAANGRAQAYAQAGTNNVARSQFETEQQGPLPKYKRVATELQMGDQVTQRKAILAKARETLDGLRGNKDVTDQPICNDVGTPAGNTILAELTQQLRALERIGRAPVANGDAPAPDAGQRRKEVDAAYQALEQLPGKIERSDVRGAPAGSSYQFNREQLTLLLGKLDPLRGGNEGVRAAYGTLDKLRTGHDAAGTAFVHDGQTTEPARKLLGSLAVKVDAAGATRFNKKYADEASLIEGTQRAGAAKFRTADVNALEETLTRLEAHNVLQPSELDQVSSLTAQLAPDH